MLEPGDGSHRSGQSESASDHQVFFCGESGAIVRRRREVASTACLLKRIDKVVRFGELPLGPFLLHSPPFGALLRLHPLETAPLETSWRSRTGMGGMGGVRREAREGSLRPTFDIPPGDYPILGLAAAVGSLFRFVRSFVSVDTISEGNPLVVVETVRGPERGAVPAGGAGYRWHRESES
jgi:hypothetical protein